MMKRGSCRQLSPLFGHASQAGWWVGTWYRAMAYAAMQAYGTSASGGAAGAQPGAQEAPAVEGAVRDRENARVEVPGTGRRISAEEGRGDNSAPALPPLNPRGNPIETPPKKSGFE